MSLIEDIKRDREAGSQGDWGLSRKNLITGFISEDYRYLRCGSWNQFAELVARTTMEGSLPRNEGEAEANANRIARVPDMEAALLAAEELYRATNFLTDNDPDDVVCDGGGTAILVGLSGIRHALDAYRKATGDTQ